MRTPSFSDLVGRLTNTKLPTVPEPTVYDGGRIGWPGVFKYAIQVSKSAVVHSALPPLEANTPFTVEVYDNAAYEVLGALGLLRDRRHTGARGGEVVDNRKTS